MPKHRTRALRRRAALAVILGGTVGLVGRYGPGTVSGDSGGTGGTGKVSGGPGGSGAAGSAPGVSGAGVPGPSGATIPGPIPGAGPGQGPGPAERQVGGTAVVADGPATTREAVSWSRMRSEPAYAWAEGSGWAPSLRSAPYGPLVTSTVLPRGGRTVFPRFRLVGFCGLPGAPALGRMGIGALRDRVADIERMAGQYAVDRQPLPVLELITVVAQAAPGPDGMYRSRIPAPVIRDHLGAARAGGALLLLNVQPGRARFLDEIRALEPWLREPDVGVALDPEWAVAPGQVPGRVFGHVGGAELDTVAGYLADLVALGGLPEKVMVVHQLAPSIIRAQGALRRHPGVAVVKSVDGIGGAAAKRSTWRRLVPGMPPVIHPGFKLFFDEDTRGGLALMTPAQVLALTPTPEYVMYE